MVEKPVFDFKIKHVPSVHGCGDEQFCGALNSLELIKNTLMAQEGVIV